MSSPDNDYLKIEKAKAIARYRLFRNIAKLIQVLEIIAALSLLSWSSTRLPSVLKYSGDVFQYLLNPRAVFFIGNAIIICLVLLSRQNSSGNTTGETDSACDEDYVNHSEIQQEVDGETSPSSPAPETERETRTDFDDSENNKQIVCFENAVSQPQCDALAEAIEKATKQIRKFQRTQSEKLKREISVKSRLELRRSESDSREVILIAGARRTVMTPSLHKVDNLSNEEFRVTVEAFIEKHQRFFKAQKIAEQISKNKKKN